MKSMDALQIIKEELYKDTLPTVEVQNALDCLEEYITTPRVKVTSEALANIRKNTLKEFVEWYKAHLNYLVEYEKDLYADAKNNKHEDNATFFAGEINMLQRLLGWIDRKTEQFLEERK